MASRAITDLRTAFDGRGKEPMAYFRVRSRLKNEWPTLWEAIEGVLAEAERPVHEFIQHSITIWESIDRDPLHEHHTVAPYYLDAFGMVLAVLEDVPYPEEL